MPSCFSHPGFFLGSVLSVPCPLSVTIIFWTKDDWLIFLGHSHVAVCLRQAPVNMSNNFFLTMQSQFKGTNFLVFFSATSTTLILSGRGPFFVVSFMIKRLTILDNCEHFPLLSKEQQPFHCGMTLARNSGHYNKMIYKYSLLYKLEKNVSHHN